MNPEATNAALDLREWLGSGPDGSAYTGVDADGRAVEVRSLIAYPRELARRLSRLVLVDHPSVRRVLECRADPPRIVLERVERPWSDPAHRPRDRDSVLETFRTLVAAMGDAHALGVVHGSLCAADVARRASGELAIDLSGTRTADVPHLALAPELGEDPPPTGAADVWALAELMRPIAAAASGDVLHVLGPILDAMQHPEPEMRPRAARIALELDAARASPRREGDPALPDDLPRRLGAYEIEREIGSGGMGRVFRARDVATGELVALKVLAAHVASDAEAVARFHREARILASVRSPYVARFVEASEIAGRHFLAMELVGGRSAKSLLQTRGPLPPAEALGIALSVARALADVHALGLVHRDVKPANILLGDDYDPEQPIAKLCDFGIARSASAGDGTSLTTEGVVPGTIVYMSPEQLTGDEIDARSDVYALGVTLYQLLVGQPPFVGDPALVMLAHVGEPAPDVRERRPDVPDAIAGIVARALAKAPAERFADAGEMLAAIEIAQRGEISADALPQPLALEGTPLVYEGAWELASSAQELWPHVSNTERLNRAIGLDDVEWSHATRPDEGVLRRGTMRAAGMTLRWKENPFEWVAPYRLGVVREYSSGPFEWLRSTVQLTARERGTQVRHRIEIRPRNLLGRVAAGIEVGIRTRRALERVYRRIDESCVRARSGPTSGSAAMDPFETSPSISAASASRIERALERVANAGGDPYVIEALARFVRTASPQRIARIRPEEWAREHELDADAVVTTMLHAAHEGLLIALWDILCPACRVPGSMAATLREIGEHAHCEACDLDFENDLARSVELVFRVRPEIREPDVGLYCIGGPAHSPHVHAQVRLAAGQRLAFDLALPDGAYRVVARGVTSWGFRVHARAASTGWDLPLLAGPAIDAPRSLRSGAQRIALTSDLEREVVVRVESVADRADALTAADAAANALFRRLFPDELLAPEQLVGVSQVALLFVGIADAPRRVMGDERAAHRDLLELVARVREASELEGGALVKLHGDAVLAVFSDALPAVRTGLAVVGRTADARGSVHAGAAMMTSIQDRLDYFGRTVHVGASLLERGAPGEVVIGDDATRDPAVIDVVRARGDVVGAAQVGPVVAMRVRARGADGERAGSPPPPRAPAPSTSAGGSGPS